MASLIGKNVRSYSIFVLLKMCMFSEIILLGDGENIEAIFNIRLEASTESYFQYFIYSDKYPLFQDLFFNKTITTLQLRYSYSGLDRNIYDIVFFNGQPQNNGTYYSCQNMANISVIQCQKFPGTSDSLSEKCSNGTNFQWRHRDEYLSSSYLHNKTITSKQEKDFRLTCYMLVNNHTFKPETSKSTSLNAHTGSSLAPITIIPKDSSALSSGAIVGIIVGILTLIIAIIIVVVILRRKKQNKDTKIKDLSNMQSTNTRNAYNGQDLSKRENNILTNANNITLATSTVNPSLNIFKHISDINHNGTETEPDYVGIEKDYSVSIDTRLSMTTATNNDYTYIEDNDNDRDWQCGDLDDGYTTLDQTLAGFTGSVEENQRIISDGVPNYNNVYIQKADNNDNLRRKKDVYSKLGETVRTNQDTYGELEERNHDGEIQCRELNTDNVNNNKDNEKRKDVYSKLREKNVNFENTYGELDQDVVKVEENLRQQEVNNTYFELEKENSTVYTSGKTTS